MTGKYCPKCGKLIHLGMGSAVVCGMFPLCEKQEPPPQPSQTVDSAELAACRALILKESNSAHMVNSLSSRLTNAGLTLLSAVDWLTKTLESERKLYADTLPAKEAEQHIAAAISRLTIERDELRSKLETAWQGIASNNATHDAEKEELRAKLAEAETWREEEMQRAERYRTDLDNCGSTFMALRESSSSSLRRAEAAEASLAEEKLGRETAEGVAEERRIIAKLAESRAEAADRRVRELEDEVRREHRSLDSFGI
jgi:hypothetical protein